MFVLGAGYERERAWFAKQERARIPERARWASEESVKINMGLLVCFIISLYVIL